MILKYSQVMILIAAFTFSSCVCNTQNENETTVRAALTDQLRAYPASTLKDIYKSFFQASFGPGHLLKDTMAAWEYLLEEVSAMKSKSNHLAEPCGPGDHFVRVPLDLVKDGIIDTTAFFEAFLESSRSFTMPDVRHWKEEWDGILKVLEKMDLDIEGYKEDKDEIFRMLESGETVVHHSGSYTGHYDPHYRVMTVEQWRKLQQESR